LCNERHHGCAMSVINTVNDKVFLEA
jgi:hypothetical protein